MRKYIELTKVLSELGLDHKDYVYIDKHEVAERIKKLPSIDIVRCKECKHRYRSGYRGDEYWVCDFMDAKIKDDDFCSYGERRN